MSVAPEAQRGPLVLHPALEAVFRGLDERTVRWALLRGEAELDSPAGDVDLLVDEQSIPVLRDVCERLGFARIPAWGYGPHVFFLTYHRATDTWVKLDVVTELAFGRSFELRAAVEDACLARRRRRGPVAVLADGDAFWALLLHELLDTDAARPRDDERRLRQLAAAASRDDPLAHAVDARCPPGWKAERIIEEAESGAWATLRELAPRLADSWRRHERTVTRRRALENSWWKWRGRLFRLRGRRGLTLALVAPDGAGKSTAAAGIQRSFYFPTRTIYMGGLHRHLAARGRQSLPPVIGITTRLVTQWARWLKGAYHKRRSRLVVFDRYSVYDASLPRLVSRRAGVRRWLLAHTCPAPDSVVLLDAPGTVLYARKGERDAAALEEQRGHYRALLEGRADAEVVDATNDGEQVRRDVTAAIWRAYRRRWRAVPHPTTEAKPVV